MCLTISDRANDMYARVFLNNDITAIGAYKKLKFTINYKKGTFFLYTPIRETIIKNPIQKDNKAIQTYGNDIYGGALHLNVCPPSISFNRIHFFHSDKEYGHIFIRVDVDTKDIISFGKSNDVAVKKYTIPQKTWGSIEKQLKKHIEKGKRNGAVKR